MVTFMLRLRYSYLFYLSRNIAAKGRVLLLAADIRRHTQTIIYRKVFLFFEYPCCPSGFTLSKMFFTTETQSAQRVYLFLPIGRRRWAKTTCPSGKIMIITPAENGIYPFRLPPSLRQMKKSISL